MSCDSRSLWWWICSWLRTEPGYRQRLLRTPGHLDHMKNWKLQLVHLAVTLLYNYIMLRYISRHFSGQRWNVPRGVEEDKVGNVKTLQIINIILDLKYNLYLKNNIFLY
jgi:hypothetical protein